MTEVWQPPERYSMQKAIFLHLAHGVPCTLSFLPVAWLMNRAGGSTYLALPRYYWRARSECSSMNEDGSIGVGDQSLYRVEAGASRPGHPAEQAVIYAIAELTGARLNHLPLGALKGIGL